MAISTFVFRTSQGFGAGLTVKARHRITGVIPSGGTSSSSTETVEPGKYSVTFTNLATGVYDWTAETAGNVKICDGGLDHTNAVGTEFPMDVDWGRIGDKTATVGLDNTTISALGLGSGPRTVIPTVQDGDGNPVEGAQISYTKAAEFYTSETDVDGQVDAFNLADGTWRVAIRAFGFQYFGSTLVVDGDENPTYTLTANSPGTPSTPTQSVLTGLVLDVHGAIEEGVVVWFRMSEGPGDDGYILDSGEFFGTSNIDGELVDEDGDPLEFLIGATYAAHRGNEGEEVFKVVPNTPQFTWPQILGAA